MMNNPQTTINVASGSCASFALTVSDFSLPPWGRRALWRFPVGGVHQHHRRRQQGLNVPQQNVWGSYRQLS